MSDQRTVPQVLAQLRRRGAKGATASELGTTANRLRSKPFTDAGVREVGRQHSGRAGRPPVVFALVEAE